MFCTYKVTKYNAQSLVPEITKHLPLVSENLSIISLLGSWQPHEYVSVKGNSRLGQSGRVNEMSKMAIFRRRAIHTICMD